MSAEDVITQLTEQLDFYERQYSDGRFPMMHIKRTDLRELLDYVGRLRAGQPVEVAP